MLRHEIQFPPKDAALREDVHALGGLVGEILREQGGDALFELTEGDRVAAIRRREGDPQGSLELALRVQDRPPQLARDLARAFSTWFQVVNLVEKVHRIRRRRQYLLNDSAPQPHSVEDALRRLRDAGLSLQQVLELTQELRIEPVFMAHPTESTRRTLLRKQQRIALLLIDRLDPTLTPRERRSVWERIRAELTTGWQTEEHPRQRLTVADEREHVLFYLTEIVYRIVPAFYEEIGSALEKLFDAPAALALPNILQFGSWVGGDMDGNPDVHAKTIRETLARQQQLIVSTYFNEVQDLAAKLSQSASRVDISKALQLRIDEYSALLPGAQRTTPVRHDRMPYRVFLGLVAERLRNTYDGRPNHYDNAAQLSADIGLVAESLRSHRGLNAGYHAVQRLLRRISTFGFHLATLDIRQHTDVHHEVLAQGLADESWPQRSSAERVARLREALDRDQGPVAALGAVGRRSLWVFEAMIQCRHKYGPAAVGEYIVSGATGPDDVLAVLLLARWAEVTDKKTGQVPFDVAPQFESVEPLERCGEIMRALLAEPVYQRHLQGRGNEQVVLIGYSQSNKESGLAASRWATHRAQAELVQAMQGTAVKLKVFHGRGGSISRGGGRLDDLVRSAPPGAISGKLRVTEQGEVVNQNYGLRPIAIRSLERAFSALALATATPGQPPPEQALHLKVMQHLAEASRAAYGRLLQAAPGFYEYFRQATPIDVIERMQVGSRPASRGEREGLAGLRSVPWVFAWTQSRHMLPGWFGVGSGLAAAIEAHGESALREMRQSWPFFSVFLDDVETMLARTDLAIAAYYNGLVAAPLQRYFEPISLEYETTRRLLLAVKGQQYLLDDQPTLQRAINLRNPYIDPIHLMQVDLLKRWRRSERQDHELFAALLASISGIAQGLQSTG